MALTNLKNLGTCGICRGTILVDARLSEQEQYSDVYVCNPKCKKLIWEKKCAEEKESFQQSCSNSRCGEVLSVQGESSNIQILKFVGKIILWASVLCFVFFYIFPIIVGLLSKFVLFFFYADSSLAILDIFLYRFKLHSSELGWGITEDTPETMKSIASLFKALEKPHYVYDSVGLNPLSYHHIKLGRHYNFWIIMIIIVASLFGVFLYISFVTINYCCPFITRPCRRRTRKVVVKRFKTG